MTTEAFGQKVYKRCREKFNLEEIFNDVKNKYDIFYKNLNIEKHKLTNKVVIILLIICFILGLGNLASWMFFK